MGGKYMGETDSFELEFWVCRYGITTEMLLNDVK